MAATERAELAKFCSSRDWSKAIRILNVLINRSPSTIDFCNRAFCFSQLELHRHVIKDCDRAIELDPCYIQAYILKGHAYSALEKISNAVLVWKQGYDYALNQSTDFKQLLELEELLKENTNGIMSPEQQSVEPNRSCIESLNPEKQSVELNGSSLSMESISPEKESVELNGSSLSMESISPQKESVELNGSSLSMKSISPEKESVELNGSSGPVPTSNGHSVCETVTLKHNHKLADVSDTSNESEHLSEVQRNLVIQSNMQNGSVEKKVGTSTPVQSRSMELQIEGNSLDQSGLAEKKMVTNPLGQNGSVERMKETKNLESKPNGTYKKLSSELESHSKPIENSHNKASTSKIIFKSTGNTSEQFELSDAIKNYQKIRGALGPKTKSIRVDIRLSRGIAEVNEGRYTHAISIFDQILKENPNYPDVLIGRGTAYAFQRQLDAAIADFTKAIEANPLAGEAWKRRGQARAALGDSAGAIDDLTKALEFEPNSADILHERGIVNFKFKDLGAAVKDLSTCVQLDSTNKSAYTYLGLAQSSMGEYKRAEDSHMKAIQLDCDFLEAWTHLTQLYQDLANTTKAYECLTRALTIDDRYAKAYYMRGHLNHATGDHRNAIKDLSVGLTIESSNVECLYLRASCHHAVGQFKEAVKDYDAALDLELDSMEKFVLQCLAFYQKELALYTASRIGSEFSLFDIDGDIDPLFKEYWCKRLHPKDVCEKVYRQPPLRDSLKKGKLKKQDLSMTKQKTALVHAADFLGQKIQYHSSGFLPNQRQHRMAGLAVIEIAQKVSKTWRSLLSELKNPGKGTSKYGKRARRKDTMNTLNQNRTMDTMNMPSQNRGGPGCSTSSSSDSASYGIVEDRSTPRASMSWQDVYSLAVKWRQISEPCDPVVWINKLSDEFNAGFGSHTPITLGQGRVARYFPNFQRTFDAAKAVIMEKKFACSKADAVINLSDDRKLKDVVHAESCSDLHKVVGEDFWVATWCNSLAFEGMQLEGTRITLLKSGERGFDFAIRTPCTPSRWNDFEAEMAMAWEALCNAYCGEAYGSTDLNALEDVRNAILRMTYYWYNFMPLSRGSAVVGFVVLLGLCLAANMEFTGSIPEGLQVDWEAILTFNPDSFVESVKKWLYPNLKVTTSWKDYPDVSSTLPTTGSVIAALSSYSK